MKNIFIINGSASADSSNQKIIDHIIALTKDVFSVTVFNELKSLPHFDPELSVSHPPQAVIDLRKEMEEADGIIICTPEYVFSIPSGLKNAIEWCVSTTVFSGKPAGLITASAMGEKGHEELQLIMRTVMAEFNSDTALLIPGVKGKITREGIITDKKTEEQLSAFITAFEDLLQVHGNNIS